MSKKILVVEDNTDSRELIHVLLTKMGFTVLDALDGRDGLYRAHAEHPDLIITDIGMPHLDGIGMIRELRAQSCFEDLPIVALTSYGRKQREEAIDAGANRVLRKPSVFESLVDAVKELLEDMQMKKTAIAIENGLILSLPQPELEGLMPHLEPVELTQGEVLYEPFEPISHIYFPINSLISLISLGEDGASLEVGMMDSEGAAGLMALIGPRTVPFRALVQVPGTALRVKVEVLRNLFDKRQVLRRQLLCYMHALFTQVAQSAACNRFHSLEQRLSRWLLDSQYRLKVDTFPYTQQLLSTMLGADRVTVTLAAGAMKTEGLIQYTRGQITILNRGRLESASCECYRIVKSQFRQFL